MILVMASLSRHSLEDSSSSNTSTAITFADIGITREQTVKETFMGKTRTFFTLDKKEWLFLFVSAISILTALSFSVYKAIDAAKNNQFDYNKEDFVFALLIILNACFAMFYLLNGVFRERPYELSVLLISSGVIIIYIITNFVTTEGWNSVLKIVRLVALASLAPIMIVLGVIIVRQYLRSGSLIFRTVGADADLQRHCRRLHFCESLLRLDLQLALSGILLIINGPEQLNILEIVVLAVGVPVSIIWVGLAFIGIIFELCWLMWLVMAMSVLEPSYLIYRIVVKVMETLKPQNDTAVESTMPTVILFGAISALILRVLLLVVGSLVYKNFGSGLKHKVIPTWTKRSRLATVLIPENGSTEPKSSDSRNLADSESQIPQQLPALPRDPVSFLSQN